MHDFESWDRDKINNTNKHIEKLVQELYDMHAIPSREELDANPNIWDTKPEYQRYQKHATKRMYLAMEKMKKMNT